MIAPIALTRLAVAAGAVLEPVDVEVCISGLAIDSRQVRSGDLFAAIPGAHVDGHDFVAVAADAGAAAALVQHGLDTRLPQMIAADTEAALAALGRLARDDFKGVLVGITGSAGKTTAKNLIAAVLSGAGNVLATEGNRNNELGVPLTLTSLQPSTEFAVLEMGAGKPGDIAFLRSMARPNVAVLLNVAEAHLAQYDSVDAIAETKGAILDELPRQGLAVINGDQRWSAEWRERAGDATVVTFGLAEANDYRASDFVSHGFSGSQFVVTGPHGELDVSLQIPGTQGVMNALAAVAVADSLGVSPGVIAAGLTSVQAAAGRGRLHRLAGDISLVDDSYNANPMAMMAAIDVLASVNGHRILVMGAMLELGERSEDLHAQIGAYARECGIDELWAVGRDAQAAATAFGSKARCYESREAVMAADAIVPAGATLLVKASRGAALDRLVKHWLEEGFSVC